MSLITRESKLLVFINLLVLGYTLVTLGKIMTSEAADFSVFYQSTVNLRHGLNVYHDPTLYTGLGYPPTSLILFMPFTYLPYWLAQAVWVSGSFAMFLAILILALRLVKRLTWETMLVIFPLGFLSFPTRFTLGMGQVNFYALFFLLLSTYFLQKKPGWSVISLVIALLFKPQLVVILPIFLLLGEWRVILGTLAGYSLITLACGNTFGWFQFSSYIREALPPLLAFRGREIYYNQGLTGFFARLTPLLPAQTLVLVTSLGLWLATFFIIYRKRLTLVTGLGLFLPVFLLVEPLSWQHHFIFLFPAMIWLWPRLKNNLGKVFLGLSYLLVSVNLKSPVSWQGSAFGPLILSHVFFGTLILYILYLTLVFPKKA